MPPEKDALLTKYTELHNAFREAVSIYFKASTLGLAIFAAGLGYLLKVPLSNLYSRSICVGIIAIFVLFYVCSYRAIITYNSLTNAIRETSRALELTFEATSYRSFKVIIIAIMIAFSILLLFIFYLLINPPDLGMLTGKVNNCIH